jgi:hypothetical protein
MQNSSDTIWNRARCLPVYKAVAQPTALPRAPPPCFSVLFGIIVLNVVRKSTENVISYSLLEFEI